MKFLYNKHNIIVLFVMLICLWGMYHAFRMGVADVLAYKAEYAIKTWEKEKRLPNKSEVGAAVINASSAVSWESANPEYMDLHAQVLLYKALSYWGDNKFDPISALSVELYQRSIKRRPNWPYTWARLALVKSYRREYDAVFYEALGNAVKLGPWEPGVHTTLAAAGLFGWSELNIESRRLVASNIHRGLRFSHSELASIIHRYRRKESVCGYVTVDEFSKSLCGW